MGTDEHWVAYKGLKRLIATLKGIVDRDPEQEVMGIALPVLDEVLSHAKAVIGDDALVNRIADILSPETIEIGEPIRALDALIVAEQLMARLGVPEMRIDWV